MQYPQDTHQPEPDELLLTKLTVPRLRAPLVERASLLARLNEGLDRKLTLLSAPAGFGKTTLASQWFSAGTQAQECLPRAWVALDAGDNDPVRFWRYLFRACAAFDATLGQKALALLNAQQPAYEAALTIFINEMAQLPGRHILVLEDYHFIAAPQIHETMLFLLDHLPDSLHLMLLTRRDPPLPLARLRTRHELNEIGANELRFSIAETQELLRQALPSPISAEAIARLDERTEGWIAALRLVVLALQGKHEAAEIEQFLTNFSGGHGHILEYLVEEVLHAQSETIQTFLLHTTFLNRLTGSLCNALTGRSDSSVLLEQMESANLFLVSLGVSREGSQQWYRYHGLFAEAMNHYARQRLDPAALNALYHRASQWYEEHGLLGEAFEMALASHAYERAAHLLEQIIAPQLVQNQFHTLRHWLEQLPEAVMCLHPQLCMTFAVSILFTSNRYMPTTHDLIVPPLRMAEEQWRGQGNREKLGELLAFRSLLSWYQSNQPQAFAEAREALTLLPADDAQWRGISLIFAGLEALLNGKLNVARQELHQALELNQRANNTYGILDTLMLLGRVCTQQGDLRQAAHCYEVALKELEQKPMDREQAQLRKGRALAGLGALELEWNRLEIAEAHAAHAVAVGDAFADELLRVEATLLQAQVYQRQGKNTQAQEQLLRVASQVKQPQPRREVEVALVSLALATGDFAAAQQWSASTSSHHLPMIQQEAELLLCAQIHLAQGQFEDALAKLTASQLGALADGRGRNALKMLILTARAAFARNDWPYAKCALMHALELAQPQGFQRLFLDAGAPMAEMLRTLLREIKEESLVIYLRTLLLAFAGEKATPEALPPVDTLLLVEPLSAQERRVLRLLVANLSNPAIADELVVSLNTVKTHIKNIYAKLNVHSREEASTLARQLSLV